MKDGNGAGEKGYRTSDLARAAGAHPNTVRFYEELGFLPPAERGPNGYRLWTRAHLDQMVFARRALHGLWPGRRIRKSALDLVRIAAAKGPRTALSAARDHARLVREERARAEQAAAFLERWASGDEEPDPAGKKTPRENRLGPREAAREVGATAGQIRNWERNRLVETPRDKSTGHRYYGPREIGRLRVIRTLLLAGYSVMAVLRMATALDREEATDLRGVLDTPAEGEDALTAFDRWLSSLAEQEARAEGLIALLEERIEREKTLQ